MENLAGIERALGLPQRFLRDKKNLELPETKALLNIIKICPWLVNVADHNFDSKLAKREMVKAAIDLGILEQEIPDDKTKGTVYYNYKRNFLWFFHEDKEGYSWSSPVKNRVGKLQARNPEKYGNIYIGDL